MDELGHLSEQAAPRAVAVSEFVQRSKAVLEGHVPPTWVSGEVANFARAASGHWYFVLRDSQAQMDCVMFARDNRKISRELKLSEGDKVLLYGQPTLYAQRGRFQMTVTQLQLEGVGQLYQIFMRRKQEWQQRGWFDAARKKDIPFLPTRIGVVCSLAGAALHDILRTHQVRLPAIPIIIYPAPAQGEDAAAKIGAAIAEANKRGECDVLLVCRGGGGIEDLWAYNEAEVVEAIVESQIPIITGIGHEVDETLADYAADCRAATPTAAATRAIPEGAQLQQQLDDFAHQLSQRCNAIFAAHRERLQWVMSLITLPEYYLQQQKNQLAQRHQQLRHAFFHHTTQQREKLKSYQLRMSKPDLQARRERLQTAQRRLSVQANALLQQYKSTLNASDNALQLLSPQRVLERGYGIVYNPQQEVVTDAKQLSANEKVNIVLARGSVRATVDGLVDGAADGAADDLEKPKDLFS